MYELNFSIEGEKQVALYLDTRGKKITDFKKPLENIKGKLLTQFDQNFNTKGALLGSPWPPRKDNNSWGLLNKTGLMKKSFKGTVTGEVLEITNTANYFKYHQSNKPRKKLPRRVMMRIDNPQRKMVIEEFQKNIKRAIK